MKRTFFINKTSSLFNLVFIVNILFFTSCIKEQENDATISIGSKYLTNDLIKESSYFNVNTASNLNLDSNRLISEPRIYINLGIGREKATGVNKIGIFNNVFLNPIIEHKLNEYFTKKIIVSWNSNYCNHLIDSILITNLQLDSTYSSAPFDTVSNSNNYTTIYGSIIFIKKFGTASIDLTKNLNEYLAYKTSLNDENIKEDKITLSSNSFYNIFGDEFVSSMTLGDLLVAEFEIIYVSEEESNKEKVLKEALDMITTMFENGTKWEDLKEKSNSFKNASNFVGHMQAIPRTNTSFPYTLNIVAKNIQYLDSLYSKKDFGILSAEYLPFSRLYPKYNFIHSK